VCRHQRNQSVRWRSWGSPLPISELGLQWGFTEGRTPWDFRLGSCMPETPSLRSASSDEVAETLSIRLRYDRRKCVYHADEMMSRITADRIVRHLTETGFVVMKSPPSVSLTTSKVPRPT
jgi:hypothetical protein